MSRKQCTSHLCLYQFALATNSCSHKIQGIDVCLQNHLWLYTPLPKRITSELCASRNLHSASERRIIVPSQRDTKSMRQCSMPSVLLSEGSERTSGNRCTLLYPFPPIALLFPALHRVRKKGLKMILVAPRWPGKYWLTEIILMLYAEPWSLLLCRDLLSQAGGGRFSILIQNTWHCGPGQWVAKYECGWSAR